MHVGNTCDIFIIKHIMRKTTVVNGKKLCLKCKKQKNICEFEFRVSHNGKKYYRSPCKKCANKRKKLYSQKYRETNKGQINTEANRRIKERRANGDEKLITSLKNSRLKHLYGITLEEYNKLLVSQAGKCYICKIDSVECKKGLFVDHNHKTGAVRKLLCSRCNTVLGMVDENPELLNIIINYVREHE